MSDKESKEAFRKKAVPAFVDLLQMAKQAIILYRKRENEGEAPTFEEISFQEVLLTANCMVSVGFTAREADPAAVEALLREKGKEIAAETLKGVMEPLTARVNNPEQVHDAFTAELERQKLDVAASRRICAALVSTPAGHDMLKVMLYDAVMLKRKKEAPPGGPPAAETEA